MSGVPVKLTTRLLAVRACSWSGSFGDTFNQAALNRADHGLIDARGFGFDDFVQSFEAAHFSSCGVSSCRLAAGVPGRGL